MPGMPGMQGMPGMGRREEKLENIVHHLNVTLEQIVKEENVAFTYEQKILCKSCNGEGTKGGDPSLVKQCEKCQGKGMCVQIRNMGHMVQQSVMPCPDCSGKGKTFKEKCTDCKGEIYETRKTNGSIKLQNGLENNMKLKLDGQGHQSKNGNTDLIIIIHEEPNEVFRRNGSHLHVDIELNLYEALFGFTKLVHHVNGKTILVRYEGKTEYNTVRKLIGEGLENLRTHQKGNLYIHFTFYLPDIQDLSEIKELHEEIDMTRVKEYEEQCLLFVSKSELMNESENNENENNDENDEDSGRPHVQECRPM
jgi:DnaJ-class molecular chaperone